MTVQVLPALPSHPARARAAWGRLALAALIVLTLFGAVTVPAARAGNGATASNVVYVNSNNPDPGRNSVIAYRRNPATGGLTYFGNFLTGGTGIYNGAEILGPDDSDQEIIASPDRRFLFAVNSGSNTVAVFRINPDGSLTPIKGSPFASGGVQPVSLGLTGNQLYVVNKGDLEPGETGGAAPNYTGFRVSGNGQLTPIPHSTVEVIPGSHPSQALVSPDGKLLFGTDIFSYEFPPPPGFPSILPPFGSALQSFRIRPNGRLEQGANTPQGSPIPPPFPPYILGLQVHPTEPILYAGFVIGSALGTYRYDENGTLTFLNAASNSGVGICWIEVDKGGNFAYTSNSADDSLSTYSLANPYQPVEIQKLDLAGPKDLLCPTPEPCGIGIFTTVPYQLELDPTGTFLYVVSHETTFDDSFPEGNRLHILRVGPDGKLTETADSPVFLPQSAVPARAHPKGAVVF